MTLTDPQFVAFLVRAKQSTYAAGDAGQVASSRPASHDLAFQDGAWSYLDTYLGGFAFLGEEAVWKDGSPMWGMNYSGTMTVDTIPDGFSEFLKLALRNVPLDAPYRGPARLQQDRYEYVCHWQGNLDWYQGYEEIRLDGKVVYHLFFHGGSIR